MHDVWPPIHTLEVFLKNGWLLYLWPKKKENFLKETKRNNEIPRIKRNVHQAPLCATGFQPLTWKGRIISKQLNHEKIALSFWSGICSKSFIKCHWVQRKYRPMMGHLCKGNRSLQNDREQARVRADKDSEE